MYYYLEALEQVRVLLAVAAQEAHLLRLCLGQQDAQVVLQRLNDRLISD